MARKDAPSFATSEGMYMSNGMRGAAAAAVAAAITMTAWSGYVEAQQGRGVGVADALAAPVAPLNAITVPDVNVLGILDGVVNVDGNGDPINPGADAWPAIFGGAITNPDQRIALQQLGKALFWDMQVGGDGIQACATCHYHAGADNRITNQISPGLKRVHGGEDPVSAENRWPDNDVLDGQGQDLAEPNHTLAAADYAAVNAAGDPVGLPVNEAALVDWSPDDPNGVPGVIGTKANPSFDVNDVVSSQGIRLGAYDSTTLIEVCVDLQAGETEVACLTLQDLTADGVDNPTLEPNPAVDYSFFTAGRDAATLATDDPGFNLTTTGFDTVRRVEPRNSPTSINAVYHMRNFWDGRADMFFNGVTPLGFRDPGAAVKVYSGGAVTDQKLRIPFSSLASQAVGPIESDFEMVFAGRPHKDLGKKLLQAGVQPLAGQKVHATDSLLGGLRDAGRNDRGLTKSYEAFIREIFDERFWGDGSGNHVCLDASGTLAATCPVNGYTLMEWNFSMFFGLAVQAYEATLTTEETIVDLLAGGIATGQVRIDTVDRRGRVTAGTPVTVDGLPFDGCVALVAQNNNAAAQATAEQLCAQHYSQFIHPDAMAGSQAAATGFLKISGNPVTAGERIGGCDAPSLLTTVSNNRGALTFSDACNPATVEAAHATLLAVNRGLGRFFAGATGCGICHFNPEFTGATVAALTGFGAAPPPPLPPGQLRREALEVPMERMITFNGAPAVYDAGFYNLGVRPTAEDISLGDQILGVPLAFSKLQELMNGGNLAGYDSANVQAVADELNAVSGTVTLNIPTGLDPATGVFTLAPKPWTLELACAPGLVGGGNANNNPQQNCVPTVIAGERLLKNGAFKAQGLRNVKFTGPYLHNGSKMNLSQLVNFYETAGHFPALNFNNLDAGMRLFDLGPADTAAMIEMMETGLTDWRLAYEEGKFDHPELCVPHGHDETTGTTLLAGIPAVGVDGHTDPLATFEEILLGEAADRGHHLGDACTVPGLDNNDIPPAPAS